MHGEEGSGEQIRQLCKREAGLAGVFTDTLTENMRAGCGFSWTCDAELAGWPACSSLAALHQQNDCLHLTAAAASQTGHSAACWHTEDITLEFHLYQQNNSCFTSIP